MHSQAKKQDYFQATETSARTESITLVRLDLSIKMNVSSRR
jgi:hypothetical protein